MKRTAPTPKHLARLYYELGRIGARSVGEKLRWPFGSLTPEALFTLAADWSRWDPRLLEILVQYGIEHWRDLNPQQLREKLRTMEMPQTLGVIASFIQTAKSEESELLFFWNYVVQGIEPAPSQFYFCNLHQPGSPRAERTARESLSEFKQWGFLGLERVITDSKTKKSVGTLPVDSRLNLLRRLFKQKTSIQISDYLEALKNSISRQQALLDLKALPAKQHGKGRSAHWMLSRARKTA